MVSTSEAQAAPGSLEQVRELLNTWLIPNDERVPTDRFDEHRHRRALRSADAATVRELRDDLRAVVERTADADEVLTGWIDRLGLQGVVEGGAVRFRQPRDEAGRSAGAVLVVVLDAIKSGTWSRLKACPDCRWVFYDHTRSGTKRWCLMNAGGPDGRGCGNIAKARRHRARRRASS